MKQNTLPLKFYDGVENFDVRSALRCETSNILTEEGEFLPSVNEDDLSTLHKSIDYGKNQLEKGDVGFYIQDIVNKCLDKFIPLAEMLREHLDTKKGETVELKDDASLSVENSSTKKKKKNSGKVKL